ncbi:MAG TPA: hypothetical protein VD969_18405 [Symbiobacteriaceae bacterium]|nr:hypothetical protein [Symbiobacteriaceae bacterium]
MRNRLLGLTVVVAVSAAGCGRSMACAPVKDGVGVCLDGAPRALGLPARK